MNEKNGRHYLSPEAYAASEALAKAQVLKDQDGASKALDTLIDVAMREAEQRYPGVNGMPMGDLARLMIASIPVMRFVPEELVVLRLARRVFRPAAPAPPSTP